MIHHGSNRLQDSATFKTVLSDYDVVITSYTLVRKDAKLLQTPNWQRIVLDEAQNIKNPTAAQTKAILKLQTDRRLALTGTPVENRLLDLWSIFNFLNPSYLGKESQFRKSFEMPIQKDNNQVQSIVLKNSFNLLSCVASRLTSKLLKTYRIKSNTNSIYLWHNLAELGGERNSLKL